MKGTKHLKEDERQRVRTLHFDAKLTNSEIQKITGYTENQIRTAISASSAKVAPRSGRPLLLTPEQQEELIEYVTASKAGCRASFLQLSLTLFNAEYGAYVIRYTLRRLGFKRYVARKKPPITEANRVKRLNWALQHKDWTP